MKGKFVLLCAPLSLTLLLLGCGGGTTMSMQSGSGFQQTNLVSDTPGIANHTDRGLLNPWGIAFMPGGPFWIPNNNTGVAQQFDASGLPQAPLAVAIPAPPADTSAAKPTGIIFNPVAGDFLFFHTPAQFIFATEDGTISTWSTVNGDTPTSGLLAVDFSQGGVVYKGLAILTPACCREFLAVANFHSGVISTFTNEFALLGPPGDFTDPNLPAGYAPLNIQPIGNQVFITYALQDAAKHDPVTGPGNGIVDLFDLEGNFISRFASNGPLNAPWGVTQASANFGPFSNDILIGNFGDGTINAFDPATGNFLGPLKDRTGKVITNPGLWALVFRNDGVGDPNTLYFTAGGSNEQHGLFGAISFHN